MFLGNLVGNHCRKVIAKAAKTALLINTELSDHIPLFETLDSIFTLLSSETVYTNAVIVKLESDLVEFANLWRQSDLNLSNNMVKLHVFVSHLPDQVRQFKFSPAKVGEQKLEESHQKVFTMYGHYGHSDNRILPFISEYNGLQF